MTLTPEVKANRQRKLAAGILSQAEYDRQTQSRGPEYIAPLIARYLDRLRGVLAERNVRAPILVMQSNGGLISASSAAARPVTIIESGPAAGVVAAQRMARACGYPNVITLDMGGTTTKASIIERGEILAHGSLESIRSRAPSRSVEDVFVSVVTAAPGGPTDDR